MTDHEWSELRKAADNYAALAWHRGAERPAPGLRPNANEEDRIVYRFYALIDRADRIEAELVRARTTFQYMVYHGWTGDRAQMDNIDAALKPIEEDR